MTSEVRASFEIKGWDERPFDEGLGVAKLTKASVAKEYAGDVEGSSATEWLMAYNPDESADFVGIERAAFVELGIATPFSFLRGASDAIELAMTGLELGMDSIGVADRNTLAGVVRMHSAAAGAGLRPLIGCRIDPIDAPIM